MMCDLAGSEKVRNTGTKYGSIEFEQMRNINYGLSQLGNVLSALTSKDGRTPPYMNSKLTRILMDSLGGNCKTSLICGGRPDMAFGDESSSTLRFGSNAKKIRNRVTKNETLTVAEYKKRHARMEEKLKQFEIQIRRAEKIKLYTKKLESFAAESGLDVQAWAQTQNISTLEDLCELEEKREEDCDSEDEDAVMGTRRHRSGLTPMAQGNQDIYRELAKLKYELSMKDEEIHDMGAEIESKNFKLEALEFENLDLADQTAGIQKQGDEILALQGSNYQKKRRMEYLQAKNREQEMLIQRMRGEQTQLSMNLLTSSTTVMNDYSQKELKRIHHAITNGDAQAICDVVTDMAQQQQEIKRLKATLVSQQKQMENIHNLRKKEMESKRNQESIMIDIYAKYKMEDNKHTCSLQQRDNTIAMLRRQIEELKKQRNQFKRNVEVLEGREKVAIRERFQEDPVGFFNQLRSSAVKKQMTTNRNLRPVVKRRTKRKMDLRPLKMAPVKITRTHLGMTSPSA